MQNNLNLTRKQNALEFPNRNDSYFFISGPSSHEGGPCDLAGWRGAGEPRVGLLGPCPGDKSVGLSFGHCRDLNRFKSVSIGDFLGLFKEMALENLTCFQRRGWEHNSALCWPTGGNSPESGPQGLA